MLFRSYKLQVVAAIWNVRGEENQGGDGWTRMRQVYSDTKALKRLISDFRMEGPMCLGGDEPKCLLRSPKGPLKHRRDEQLRAVPPWVRLHGSCSRHSGRGCTLLRERV